MKLIFQLTLEYIFTRFKADKIHATGAVLIALGLVLPLGAVHTRSGLISALADAR